MKRMKTAAVLGAVFALAVDGSAGRFFRVIVTDP